MCVYVCVSVCVCVCVRACVRACMYLLCAMCEFDHTSNSLSSRRGALKTCFTYAAINQLLNI